MESEKDKKDKLAAARKKLNEYKLNKSASKTSPGVNSSKPADVPVFYQNLNAPPVYNFFNPAALDNNNGSANQFYNMPASTNQEEERVPVPPSTTEMGAPGGNELAQVWQQPPPPNVDHHQTQGIFEGGVTSVVQPDEVLLSTTDIETGAASSASALLLPSAEQNVHPVDFQQADVNNYDKDSIKDTANSLFTASNFFTQNHENESKAADEYRPSAPSIEAEALPASSNTFSGTVSSFSSHEIPMATLTFNSDSADTPTQQAGSAFNSSQDYFKSQDEAPQVLASSVFNMLSSSGNNELANAFTEFIHKNTQLTASSTDGDIKTTQISSHMMMIDVNPLIKPVQELISPEMEECIDLVNSQTVSETELAKEVMETLESEGRDPEKGITQPQSVEMDSLLDLNVDVQELPDQNVILTQHNQETLETTTTTSFPITKDESFQQHENMREDSDRQSNGISANSEAYQQMKSVQEALELQIEELRRENSHLLSRQTELTVKFEESDRLAHEFKLERDRVKEEATTTSQALRSRINSLCEENQRILKNSTEVGVDQRAKLEDKTRQLEEMQKAVIIVSQSKMDFAGRLDHELERVKDLQNLLKEQDDEIQFLRTSNSNLEEKLRQEQQKDAVIHQLQDQARHYQVQCETLSKELNFLRKKVSIPEIHGEASSVKHASAPFHNNEENIHGPQHPENDTHEHDHSEQSTTKVAFNNASADSHSCTHEVHHHEQEIGSQVTSSDHGHETGSSDQHSHSFDHGEHEEHSHEHHSHSHDHSHHSHDHHHHHEEHVDEESPGVVARLGPSDEVSELKKTLHRLQWENSTYRNDLDVLAVDAKQKKSYEEKCASLEAENEYLKIEVEKLEHVVIQLQGENDTIGDYITLYQTQKMALKECAKEKDAQLELLAREREILLTRLSELTNLVRDLKESKSEAGSQCEVPVTAGTNKHQLEGKIRNLLTEISSSTLIENFHPCAVCSGRLMTV